ncbi:MAG: S9 family peptidase [Terracidiphilus sp.]|nr:S9 family peptidase [Terracidiphilus sp.]
MRKLLLVSLASLAFTALSLAQDAPQKRPMTFQDMISMKRLGETSVSPDGKWLVYAVTTMSLEQNKGSREIFIQPIAGGEPKKFAVTRPGDSGVQFSSDGKRILFLSSRQGSQQIWTADFDTATGAADNATRLTNISTEADNALWAPNSRSIVFTSSVYPDCPAMTTANSDAGDKCNSDRDTAAAQSKVKAQIFDHLLYRHWNHYTGPKRSHLFEVKVEGGALRDLTPNDPHDVPPFSLGGDGGFAFSPDSKELAFTENLDPEPATSTNANIFTLDLTKPSAKPVKISTAKGGDFSPAYSPDGKFIAWRSQERAGYEADRFRLMLYDREKKTVKDLLKGIRLPNMESVAFDNWVDEFVWDEDSSYINFVSGAKGNSFLYGIGIKDGDLHPYENVRGEWSAIHTTPLRDHGNSWIVGTLMHVASPSEVVVLDQDKAAGISQEYIPRQLTHLNDALLAQLDLPKLENFWFTAKDGTKLQGFVIPPPAFDAHKKYPVKFLIHGGPQGAWGDAWSYRWNAELFAANGYVVVMINPRGSTGYGQAVVDGVNGDWGGKPFTDLMEGLDVAEKKFPFIDKSRECALGASYGGYMANWILGHSDHFKCIVTHDGMFNPESAFGSTEELWFNEWEFKGRPWDYYGKPDDENPFHKWAPMRAAKNFKTPTLVVHGQLDYRLDVSEGFQLFTTLQLMHVPSKMLYFPDEGHWVLKPQNSELWWKTVNDWVDQWTKSSH